jgi:hypothetical protein
MRSENGNQAPSFWCSAPILVTGYLGGATATQVRVGDPWFLFPVAFGVMAWAGLWCRSPRVRALLPLMR